MVNSYPLDTVLRCSVQIKLNGVLTDPTTITLTFLHPGGTLNVFSIGGGVVKDSVGNYSAALVCDAAGSWWYRWQSTGAVIAATDDQKFLVSNSRLVP